MSELATCAVGKFMAKQTKRKMQHAPHVSPTLGLQGHVIHEIHLVLPNPIVRK